MVAVLDANILIDCTQIHILASLMTLDYQFITTDLIVAELITQQGKTSVQSCIDKGQLSLELLDAEFLEKTAKLAEQNQSLSLSDCSVWLLALERDAVLLSGDAELRKKSQSMGVEVRGILWVIERLLEKDSTLTNEICEKVQTLKKINKRLPQKELDNLIERICR